MSKWIFLSKGKEDEYINQFAVGCGELPVDPSGFKPADSSEPIVLRGILKKRIIHKCWDIGRTFYYMDTGYFGNERTPLNPNGWKYWHRIVKNDLQHGNKIIPRPDDRFKIFQKKFVPWKKDGRKILIAKPDEKPMKFYGHDLDQWLDDTVTEIKKYTDRPIEIRDRAPNRIDRIANDTLESALKKDIFALVTFNSNAAVESIFQGIPVFVLSPTHAASPVARTDLSEIENPYYADMDELVAWGRHLSYGMFHVSELRTGKAKKLLEEWWPN
jgi:hypothetical protein